MLTLVLIIKECLLNMAVEVYKGDFVIDKWGVLSKYAGNEEEVVIPSFAVSISAYAFKGCSKLKRVIIPKTIQSIDNLAFVGCHSLRDVYFVGSKAEYQAKNAVNRAFSAKVNVHFNYVKPVKQKKDEEAKFVHDIVGSNFSVEVYRMLRTGKYTVGEVAQVFCKKYPEDVVNKAIVSALKDQYLV